MQSRQHRLQQGLAVHRPVRGEVPENPGVVHLQRVGLQRSSDTSTQRPHLFTCWRPLASPRALTARTVSGHGSRKEDLEAGSFREFMMH